MKYPRTFHFSFSPEIHSDDKRLNPKAEKKNFINKEIVITEKLDGGSCCLKNGEVFARSHSEPTNHPSFSMVRRINAFLSINKDIADLEIYGENMQGIHSIEYHDLKSPFYIFNIKRNGQWLSWDEVESVSDSLHIPTVPVVFRGSFSSIENLASFLDSEIRNKSNLGGPREGFVVRQVASFSEDAFSTVVGKYVRKGHVQSDEHWMRTWKEARIDNGFWENLYN